MYGIYHKVYDDLLKYFNDNPSIYKVILFGSRAKDNAKYNSDIDLAIHCEKKYKCKPTKETYLSWFTILI